jgi:putative salt-induced outer membrane protein
MVLAGSLSLVTTVAAETEVEDGKWSGSASLGGIVTSGNTDNQSITGSIGVSRRSGDNSHSFFGSIFRAEEDGVESADRSEIGYSFDRYFDDPLFWFARLRYDTDTFSNIDSRSSVVIGMGSTFIHNDMHTLTGRGGIGFGETEFVDNSESVDGTVVFAGLEYQAKLGESLSFHSSLTTELSTNTLTIWDSSLRYSVSDSFSVSLGYLRRDNGDVEGELGETVDTITSLNLIYGI